MEEEMVGEIDIYSYSCNQDGNIEITLWADNPGRHKLVITEKVIKRMGKVCDLNKASKEER